LGRKRRQFGEERLYSYLGAGGHVWRRIVKFWLLSIGIGNADSNTDDVKNKIKPKSRTFHTVPHNTEL